VPGYHSRLSVFLATGLLHILYIRWRKKSSEVRLFSEQGHQITQSRRKFMRRLPVKPAAPTVTIRVAGSLSQGHLSYLDQLVSSAIECALWPLLDLANLEELDRVALLYLVGGEGRDFGIVACPNFVREWMQREKAQCAA
jgi:hypothetical protein